MQAKAVDLVTAVFFATDKCSVSALKSFCEALNAPNPAVVTQVAASLQVQCSLSHVDSRILDTYV